MQIARDARDAKKKAEFEAALSEGRFTTRQMTASERAASDLRREERAAEGASARPPRY
jgi:hypothetical protein